VAAKPEETVAKRSRFMTKAEKAALERAATAPAKTEEEPAVPLSKAISLKVDVAVTSPSATRRQEGFTSPNAAEEDEPPALNITKEEAFKRLRIRRQPVTLFGETDKQRLKRLKHIELTAPAVDESIVGQRNFLHEQQKASEELKAAAEKKTKEVKVWNEDEAKCREDFILFWLKRMLLEWEQEMEPKMDELRRTAQGRAQLNNMLQAKEYIRPLFQQLRRKELPDDICIPLNRVIQACKRREYNKALDAYILIAIGNAPWPMGVTQVGIHTRASREKIHSSGVAHVLNDETTRKYIQTVKRIMTFAQHKYPPADLALAVV